MEYKVWYNYLLFRLGLRKVLPKKIISNVKIEENNEELVMVDSNRFIFDDMIEKPVYLRKSVYDKLCVFDEIVKEKSYKIKLFDAYRSIDKQKEVWLQALDETKKENPNANEEEIIRITTLKVANPTSGIGGHQTGGAIDITLLDKDGNELDMGSKYLEHIPQTKTYCKDINDVQKSNREYLLKNLEKLGFVNFPTEWWHYCYGDKMWAAYSNKKTCMYGYVEPKVKVKELKR